MVRLMISFIIILLSQNISFAQDTRLHEFVDGEILRSGDLNGNFKALIELIKKQQNRISSLENTMLPKETAKKTYLTEKDVQNKFIKKSVAPLLSQVRPGTILAYAGTIDQNVQEILRKSGWLLCHGDELRKSDYRDLYKAIGDNWGKPTDSGDFKLPDLRGLFLRGVNQDRNDLFKDPQAMIRKQVDGSQHPSPNQPGSFQEYATASPRNSFKADDAGAHTHTMQRVLISGEVHDDSKDLQTNAGGYRAHWDDKGTSSDGRHHHSISGGDLETRPNNAYVEWIIKF